MTDSNSNYSDLPLGWKRVKLPYFCHLIMGQSPPSSTYNTQKIGLPFYQGKSEFGHIYPNPQKYCSKPNKIAEKGDILLSVRAPVGATNVCLEKSCIGRGLAALRPLENSSTKFIFFLFRYLEPILAKAGTGTTFKAINKDFLCQLELNVPPLPEQHRIVEKIEELFSELDNGVASLKKALEQLKTYRQAVLKWAFEGKLTEKWRNTHQDSLEDADTLLEQIKAERKRHYQQQLEDWKQALKEWENNGKETKKTTAPRKQEYYSPLKQEETNKLWKIPDKWTWEKVGNICQSIVPNRDKPKSFSGNIPWITTPDIDSDLITLKLLPNHLGLNINEVELYNARVIPKNSVIMTCVGSFGIVCINTISCVINQQLHAFMTHSYINNKYLAYALKIQQSWMEKKSTSTTVVYLNKTNSNSVPIPLCSLQEQTKIVQEIESRLSICDQLEATLTENLDKAEALRQSILKRAFEGKVVL